MTSNGQLAALQARELAAMAIDLAPSEPAKARSLLAKIPPALAADPERGSMMARARGLIALAAGDARTGAGELATAVSIAEAGDLAHRGAEARMSLAFALFLRGDSRTALQELDRAEAVLRGDLAARVQMQRALILARLGRFDEALGGYRAALQGFRRFDDRLWEAKLRENRGWLLSYRGQWRLAEADLETAHELYVAGGYPGSAAGAQHNLGFLAALRGDVPAALERFDQAEEQYRQAGRYRGQLLLDRAELLLSVGLIVEGRRDAEAAIVESTARRAAADLAEGRLVLARAALLGGDLALARRTAEAAARAFRRQARPAWAALARYIVLRCAFATAPNDASTLRMARNAAAALAGVGWVLPASDAHIIAARVALSRGQHAVAEAELGLVARLSRLGPAELRARAWHAEALRRLAAQDGRGAERALRAGLHVLDRFRATLGATELRAQVSAQAEDLVSLGLRLALQSGRARRVLAWSERSRAGALRFRPARPQGDEALQNDLTRLRRVVRELEESVLEGGDSGPLLREQAALERAVRRRARHAQGPPAHVATLLPDQLFDALGEAALVEFLTVDGGLLALVVAGGRVQRREVCETALAERELEVLRFAMRRSAYRQGSPRMQAASIASLRAAAGRLDDLLLSPLRQAVRDRPLVVVPTGPLHALPWGVLPSLAERRVVVTPSAGLWCRAQVAGSPTEGGTLLVAGPGLPQAAQEISELAEHYPEAACLAGSSATVSHVLKALDGARLAHVAAHGSFRADNPLFSRLELADGPLTVYDLERLRRAPETLVLSACESGLSDVRTGDELMGLAGALLALGTRMLVASVAPVPDQGTRALMRSFHGHLQAGWSVPDALCRAQSDARRGEDADVIAAAGFVCFGAG